MKTGVRSELGQIVVSVARSHIPGMLMFAKEWSGKTALFMLSMPCICLLASAEHMALEVEISSSPLMSLEAYLK